MRYCVGVTKDLHVYVTTHQSQPVQFVRLFVDGYILHNSPQSADVVPLLNIASYFEVEIVEYEYIVADITVVV